MFDAFCMTIDDAGRRFAGYPKRVRDNLRVVCVIITDGHENDSKKFGMEQVKDRIRKQEQDYSWVFQFLGANIDAIGAAQQIGIVGSRAANFSPTAQGAGQVFRKMSDKARSYGVSGQSMACEYTAADRSDLMGEQDDGGKLRVPQPVQDQVHGRYRRVLNLRPNNAVPRCSVCGREVVSIAQSVAKEKHKKKAKAKV